MVALCLVSSVPVYAAHLIKVEQSIDQKKVIVHGEVGGKDHLSVLMLKKDQQADSLKNLYSGDVSPFISDLKEFDVEKGEYTFELSLANGQESGYYIIRLFSKRDGKLYEKSVYLYGSGATESYLKQFKMAESSYEVITILNDETFRHAAKIDEDLYLALNAEDIELCALALYKQQQDINSGEELANAVMFQFIMRAFEGDLLSSRYIVFLTDFAVLIGLDVCEKYDVFMKFESLGKTTVAEKLAGNIFTGEEQFLKRFNEAVVLTEIKLAGSPMSVPQILTENRNLLSEYDMQKYWEATSNYKLNDYICSCDFNNFDELEEAIKNYQFEETIRPGGGGSGSGGSGSGSFGGNSNEITVEQTDDVKVKPEICFSDISNGYWAKDEIMGLTKLGVINGRNNNLFEPEGDVTRAETVKMLLLAFSIPTNEAKLPFEDVSETAWYYPYIAGAYTSGLVSGQSETSFGPDKKITREDLAVLIWRFMEQRGCVNIGEGVLGFTDKVVISNYARDSISALRAIGVVSGMEDGTFMPKEFCTRAQTAKMIYNALAYLGIN